MQPTTLHEGPTNKNAAGRRFLFQCILPGPKQSVHAMATAGKERHLIAVALDNPQARWRLLGPRLLCKRGSEILLLGKGLL